MKIELEHIKKVFPDASPLLDFSATVNDGDIIAVIGPSGTGKSTLLRCINMLDPPSDGKIIFDGVEITKDKKNFEAVRNRMGMVFQSFNLFPHLTVIENVMFALLEIKKLSRQEAYDIAIEQLKLVGLQNIALKYPEELSGGQRQRVSIARTLAMNPDLILLDEPTSALDPTMVREVESVIKKLSKIGKTMMIVTHEMRLAREISNRVFYLDQGMLYEEGTPSEIFDNPKRERTKAFVNHLKVFKYRFNSLDFSYDDYHKAFINHLKNSEIVGEKLDRLLTITETIATEFLIKFLNNATEISILVKNNEDTTDLQMILYYCEKQDEIEDFAQEIFTPLANEVYIEKITDKDFNKKITINI